MHVQKLLHKMLASAMHLKRLETLNLLVMAAITLKEVSLTKLERNMALAIQERSGIKRADRFLGNKKLGSLKIFVG